MLRPLQPRVESLRRGPPAATAGRREARVRFLARVRNDRLPEVDRRLSGARGR